MLDKRYPASQVAWLTGRIAEFDRLDPNSTVFRYPDGPTTAYKGGQDPWPETWVDFRRLRRSAASMFRALEWVRLHAYVAEAGQNEAHVKQQGHCDAKQGGEPTADRPGEREIATHDEAFLLLLRQAREMAAGSTNPAAASFDVEQWLREWIQKPQPALGGRKPEEMLGSRAGVESVRRVLGAISSGAFQ